MGPDEQSAVLAESLRQQAIQQHQPYILHVLQFFQSGHLPEELRAISKPFCDLAHHLADKTNNLETACALRKLLEAKDAAVRSWLAEDRQRQAIQMMQEAAKGGAE